MRVRRFSSPRLLTLSERGAYKCGRIMRSFVVIVVASLFASCASQLIDDGLTALKGEPIQAAFDALGYPDKKEQFGGQTVYYWTRENGDYHANLKIGADERGIIESGSRFGNNGGYDLFARDMRRIASHKRGAQGRGP